MAKIPNSEKAHAIPAKLIAPDVACAWLEEIGESFGGQPAWSGDAMRRLLAAIDPLLIPVAHALAMGREVSIDDEGRVHLMVPQPWHKDADPDLDIWYDPRTATWETREEIGREVVGLVAKCHRAHSRRDLGPLDGATLLAATLGLAFLRVQEDSTGRR